MWYSRLHPHTNWFMPCILVRCSKSSDHTGGFFCGHFSKPKTVVLIWRFSRLVFVGLFITQSNWHILSHRQLSWGRDIMYMVSQSYHVHFRRRWPVVWILIERNTCCLTAFYPPKKEKSNLFHMSCSATALEYCPMVTVTRPFTYNESEACITVTWPLIANQTPESQSPDLWQPIKDLPQSHHVT